jgi:hypothetical protein
MGKAKKNHPKKESRNKSAKGGERLGFDISYLKNSSFGGSKFWLLMWMKRLQWFGATF